jgi:hypothetical protein
MVKNDSGPGHAAEGQKQYVIDLTVPSGETHIENWILPKPKGCTDKPRNNSRNSLKPSKSGSIQTFCGKVDPLNVEPTLF